MANSFSLVPKFIIFLLSLLPSSSTAQAITKGAGILSNSGYNSMSHSLHLATDSLPDSSNITVFAPYDDVFAGGQPSIDLLRLHILPGYFPFQSMKAWPSGILIPTLLDGLSLVVTSLDGAVSLNKVTVNEDPLYDDGYLIIYRIDKLFIEPPLNPNAEDEEEEAMPFSEASRVLRSKGWTTMAAFLEIRVLHKARMTVFAPVDEVLKSRIADDGKKWLSIVHRHVVPCRLSSSDLLNLEGSVLMAKLQGFKIYVSQKGGVPSMNGATVIMPEMYENDWLVVHGIDQLLGYRKTKNEIISLSEMERRLKLGPVKVTGVNYFEYY